MSWRRRCMAMSLMQRTILCVWIAAVCWSGAASAEDRDARLPAADANRIVLLELLRQGGWAMVPLGASSFMVLAIGGYVFWETRPGRILSPVLAGRGGLPMRSAGDPSWGQWMVHDRSLVGQTLARLSDFPGGPSKWTEELDRVVKIEEMRLVQWVTYLNVAAALAPMIGLLGTVSGMIGAFQTISAGGMGRPELLAGDIGEALITTATGLSIGIPAMVAFFYLRNRIELRFTEVREWIASVTGSSEEAKPNEESAAHANAEGQGGAP